MSRKFFHRVPGSLESSRLRSACEQTDLPQRVSGFCQTPLCPASFRRRGGDAALSKGDYSIAAAALMLMLLMACESSRALPPRLSEDRLEMVNRSS